MPEAGRYNRPRVCTTSRAENPNSTTTHKTLADARQHAASIPGVVSIIEIEHATDGHPCPPLADALRVALGPIVRARGVRDTARAAGMHQPTLSAWLAGTRTLPPHRLDAIARACGVRIVVSIDPITSDS